MPQASYLPKHRDRTQYLLKLSVLPIVICVIAFAKAAVKRITHLPAECYKFAWYSSSSGEYKCDYQPLDIHATLALLWLAVFAIQVGLLSLGKPALHRLAGKVGFVIAFANALGMFYLAIQDILNPMEKTDRPDDFTPFMFLVAFKLTFCLSMSLKCIKSPKRDVEGHMIWMFRGFITSFTTPVIRFYPMVLRLLAGDDCFRRNRDKFVMGSMFVSEVVSVILYSMAQKKTQPVFWSLFMKVQAVTFLYALVNEILFAAEHGTFVEGMVVCATEKLQGSS